MISLCFIGFLVFFNIILIVFNICYGLSDILEFPRFFIGFLGFSGCLEKSDYVYVFFPA